MTGDPYERLQAAKGRADEQDRVPHAIRTDAATLAALRAASPRSYFEITGRPFFCAMHVVISDEPGLFLRFSLPDDPVREEQV